MGQSYDPTDITNWENLNVMGENITPHQGFKRGSARGFFSATGGLATGAYNLVDAKGAALTLPPGSTVQRVVYKVLTTFASATSAATIALSIVAANDVKTAVAISDGTTPWTVGTLPVATTPVGATISTWLTVLKTQTAGLPLVATVAVEALTAGKLVAWVEWLYWGDIGAT